MAVGIDDHRAARRARRYLSAPRLQRLDHAIEVGHHQPQTGTRRRFPSEGIELENDPADVTRVVSRSCAVLLYREAQAKSLIELSRALQIRAPKDDVAEIVHAHSSG